MKAFHLFLLIFFIYIGCTNQEKISLLDKEIAATSILSLSFDSLLQEVQNLPSQQQDAILYQISYRNEKDIDGMQKQEKLLLKGLPLTSKKERKKIQIRLLELYEKLNEERVLGTDIKGIQLSEKLETDYSLSREEEWTIKKIKAILLSRRGLHEQYLPIWFELLAEHRAANKTELVIEDLSAIANQFAILGDQEKGLSLYKEAYQLAIENRLPDLSRQCVIRLLYLFYESKQYEEVVNYANEIGADSLASFMPSAYSVLSTCYLELQKPDSARICLNKNQKLKTGLGMTLNCSIAETYIAENRIDSALVFLEKANKQYQNQAKHLQKKSVNFSLPFNFLQPYSSLATLYQQNGNYQQAYEAFTIVEPLMRKLIKNPDQLEIQANALTRYSSFCRATKQYEKAVDLLVCRDSIQQIINKVNKERESKNLMDRLQIKDLMHKLEMQEALLTNSHRIIAVSSACAVLFLSFICAIGYIYRQRKKRLSVILNQDKEAEQPEPLATPENKMPLSSEKKLFRAAQKKVSSEKLYLNKDLNLKSLAKILGTNHSYLSSCINTCSNKNYNQWINDFRVDYLLEQIHSGKKLSDLANEAGFSSTDAFYRNFKRKTNLTPSEYLKQYPLTKES
ncbi:helix-turn-helix domain-containing protein [Parabacteroides gordonii]|uniref:helix-turn-helix domain-containing protein n=1 Tax=Parabacteroides gordonii TaxID=574930 RepID=UPI0026EE03DE|nr:helix-turn-helix domain-containing protein [Parabacteroides gordonii]